MATMLFWSQGSSIAAGPEWEGVKEMFGAEARAHQLEIHRGIPPWTCTLKLARLHGLDGWRVVSQMPDFSGKAKIGEPELTSWITRIP